MSCFATFAMDSDHLGVNTGKSENQQITEALSEDHCDKFSED